MKQPEKVKQVSRIAVVFNGSPLFTGDAGSGESNIRRYVIENDMLEAVIALPDQMFYNTGIYTYIWILSNKKSAKRQGKVQYLYDLAPKRRREDVFRDAAAKRDHRVDAQDRGYELASRGALYGRDFRIFPAKRQPA